MRIISIIASFSATVLFAFTARGETLFQKVQTYYNDGTKPALTEFVKDSVVVGKCVELAATEKPIGGVLNSFVSTNNDPLVGGNLYMTMHVAPENTTADYFLEMNYDQANYMHESVRKDLKNYQPLKNNPEPNTNELIFSYREYTIHGQIKAGVDYTIRKAVNTEGQHFIVVAARCPFQKCASGLNYRDPFMMCYVWDDKLVQPNPHGFDGE